MPEIHIIALNVVVRLVEQVYYKWK